MLLLTCAAATAFLPTARISVAGAAEKTVSFYDAVSWAAQRIQSGENRLGSLVSGPLEELKGIARNSGRKYFAALPLQDRVMLILIPAAWTAAYVSVLIAWLLAGLAAPVKGIRRFIMSGFLASAYSVYGLYWLDVRLEKLSSIGTAEVLDPLKSISKVMAAQYSIRTGSGIMGLLVCMTAAALMIWQVSGKNLK